MGTAGELDMPFWVIVSGLPASGKTTLARALASALADALADASAESSASSQDSTQAATRDAAHQANDEASQQAKHALTHVLSPRTVHLDKDDFLEPLFERHVSVDEALRHRLSRQADVLFTQGALQQPRAVLSSWWQHPQSPLATGTPLQPFMATGRRVIEVHCDCPAATAAQRFTARTRHAGHGDSRRSATQLLQQFEQAHALGPLTAEQALRHPSHGTGASTQPGADAVQRLSQEILHRLCRGAAGSLATAARSSAPGSPTHTHGRQT